MTLIQRALAQIDVLDIIDDYAAIQRELAQEFVLSYEHFLTQIRQTPKMCGRVRGCPRRREVREGLLETFPYIVTYEITSTEILILSVAHGHRNDEPWRDRFG